MNGTNQSALSGKKILYISSNWSGLLDLLTNNKKKPTGMPAFFRPIQALADNGANIKLIILSDKEISQNRTLNNYFANTEIILLKWPDKKSIEGFFLILKNLWLIFQHTKEFKPDFIYAHGSTGALGVIAAKLLNIPVGVRIYGINSYYMKFRSMGKIKFAINSPLIFLAFNLRSEFLLATNDGSPADKLNFSIGNKKTQFIYWKNGYDHVTLPISKKTLSIEPYIFYPSRILEKKQQTKAVELIAHLRKAGIHNIKLKISGHITDKKYYSQIFEKARELGVGNHVEYCGILDRKQLYFHMQHAQATVSFQKVSNLGNTLIEALSCGSVVVSFKEKSLIDFLEDGASALLVTDMEEAAEKLIKLSSNPSLTKKLRKNARQAVFSEFKPWDIRVEEELLLISKAFTIENSYANKNK